MSTSSSWLRPVLASLLVSLGGCKLVDLGQVAAFSCAEGGRCPQGQFCCADNTCRESCTGAGGGAAVGGGAGGGTGTGGGSAQDAGPACGPETCPNGCCDGNTCIPGLTASKCGRAGVACAACPSGESCMEGACTGCLQTCTTGCCTGSTCATRSVTACGANQMSCTACGIESDGCSDQGACQCGTGAPCNFGQRCVGGQCVCDATSCANGCCTASGACLRPNQQSGAQCGLNGVACAGCDSPPQATCTSDTQRTAYRSPGVCSQGQCAYPSQDFTCAFGCDGGSCTNDVCQGCLVPPQATCVGNVRRSFESPGTCTSNGCTYTQVDTTCPFGCTNGVCTTDPCSGVICNTPPAPRCSGNVRISAQPTGVCSQGQCSYTEVQTTCQFGCDATTGQCLGDACAGVTCNTPPASICTNANTRRTYVTPGACSNGGCTYATQDITCANGCNAGQCLGDPCAGVTCNMPPAAICLNGTTRRTYAAMGTCSQGGCNYTTTDTTCTFGCVNGNCQADPCSGITCNTPPSPTCASSTQRRTFAATGTCSGGNCSYTPTDTACNTPPAATCVGNTRRTYAATGTCTSGTCNYAQTDTVCAFGCTAGQCAADPCQNVSCTTPPAATCVNSTTRRTFGSPGTCGGGTCTYPQQDTVCNQPPAASCVGSNTLRTWSSTGTCASGTCNYTSTDQNCPNGCSGNACLGDPCAGVNCNTPPAADCASATSRRTYQSPGTCSGGTCSYMSTTFACNSPPANFCTGSVLTTYSSSGTCANGTCSYSTNTQTCTFGCANGQCNPDPCLNVTCNMPPAADCANGTTRRTYSLPATCSGGTCTYTATNTTCSSPPPATCNGNLVRTYSSSGTCSGGTCSYAPIDTACNSPPPQTCSNGVQRTYSGGTCNGGSCTYVETQTACQFGCSGNACMGDPCAGVSCNSPPASTCADANTVRVYSSPGTCSGGQCTYGSTTQGCMYGCQNGACLPCGPATCPDGCCSNGYCLDNYSNCMGTGGGACTSGCGFGTCYRNGCPYSWQCNAGACYCGPEILQAKSSLTSEEPNASLLPICEIQ